MKLTAIKILADENVSSKVVVYLRNIGFDVLDIKEQHWFGKADADLLQIAYAEHKNHRIGNYRIIHGGIIPCSLQIPLPNEPANSYPMVVIPYRYHIWQESVLSYPAFLSF